MIDEGLRRLSREIIVASIAPTIALEPWELERMSAMLEEYPVAPGDVLFNQGSAVEFVYFMRRGTVEISRDHGAPLQFEGNWIFGLFDYFLGVPHLRSARSRTAQNLLRIKTSDWVELLEDSFELSLDTIVLHAGDLARLEVTCSEKVRPAVAPLADSRVRMTFVERVGALQAMPPLREAGVQSVVDLASFASEGSFAPGSTLFESSEELNRLYFVVSGLVETTRQAEGGRRRFWGPNALVGGVEALGEPARGWQGRVLETSRLLWIDRDAWLEIMRNHFELVRSVLQFLALERERILARAGESQTLVFRQLGYGMAR
jgi:CRP-like cAMP-binding protein